MKDLQQANTLLQFAVSSVTLWLICAYIVATTTIKEFCLKNTIVCYKLPRVLGKILQFLCKKIVAK